MADAIPSWKAYVTATASGGGAHYGKECARLRQYGMAELVETHFLEAAQVPHPHSSRHAARPSLGANQVQLLL